MRIMSKIFIIATAVFVFKTSAGALTITNLPATSITTTSAYFNASFGGINAATGTLFYGTVDATTNATSWQSSNVVGAITDGTISTQMTSLLPYAKYYFRWSASESNVTTWASATSNFWTKPNAPTSTPAVVTISVQTDTNANLKSPTNFFRANTNLMIESGVGMSADLTVHTSATGTNIHGLGTMSTASTDDYYTASATDSLLAGKTDTNTTALLDARVMNVEGLAKTNQTDIAVLVTGKVDHVDFIILHGLAETNQSDIAVLTTGKVNLVTYNAHLIDWGNTNAGLQAQIAGKTGTNTTALLDLRVTDVEGLAETNQTRIGVLESQTHVNTLNGITGGVQIVDGTNTTVRTDGTNIYIDSTGGVTDLSGWSGYPATQAVNMASFPLYGVGTPGYYVGENFYAEDDTQLLLMFDDGSVGVHRKDTIQLTNLSMAWFGMSNLYSESSQYPRRGFVFVPNGNYGADAFSSGIFLGENGTGSNNCIAVDCYPVQDLSLAINGHSAFRGNIRVTGTSTFASVTAASLQITGGNPTNGAVWMATGTDGQGTIVRLPHIQAYDAVANVYPSGGYSNLVFGTTESQYGGKWDGINWTPGIIGKITINVGWAGKNESGLTGKIKIVLFRNGSYFLVGNNQYVSGVTDDIYVRETFNFYNTATGNYYTAVMSHSLVKTITNRTDGGYGKFVGFVTP